MIRYLLVNVKAPNFYTLTKKKKWSHTRTDDIIDWLLG